MAESSIGEILKRKGQLPEGTEVPEPEEETPVKITRPRKRRTGAPQTQTPGLTPGNIRYLTRLAEEAKHDEEKEEKIMPLQGTIGFVTLTTPYGLDTQSLLKSLPLEADKINAYLAIPKKDELTPLLDSDKKITEEKNWLQLLNNQHRAVEALAELLKENGWQEVKAISKRTKKGFFGKISTKGGVSQFFGSIWVIPYKGQWLELPPGIYPLDLPTKIKSDQEPIPDGAADIKEYQSDYNVQYFPHTIQNGQDPGLSWIREVGDPNYFACFYEKRPDLESEGYWEEGKWTGDWIFGDWVVRKTPEAVGQYLEKRFGAKLDLEKRIIFAPQNQIGPIIGRRGNFEGGHLDRLQTILDRTEKGGKKLIVRKLPSTKVGPQKKST